MARAAKLKVYRTPIGFHDAYVAAPSQKAALEAWGSDNNLFAQKVAEIVTDPALIEEPLAHPGVVVKRLRGTAAEQLAALGPDTKKKPQPKESAEQQPASKSKPAPEKKPQKPKPRPDRSKLARAEQDLVDAESNHAAAMKAIRDQEIALARQRREVELAYRDESERLEDARAGANAAYEKAVKAWRG
ncbi:MAG: hypothetical protein JWL66_1455 [Sphingomonadales bacterium]|nr:hypothetical protein [Sphingomonadales bacterium]